ncbi:MAG: AtpZ/AtpI family protein [Myxococcota bacterium]
MTDPLEDAVRQRSERASRWAREGERPMAKNLALIGVVGWLVVIPMLLGVAAGRWLDARFDTGITLTAALLVVGLAAGVTLAWRRIREA